MPWVSKLQPDGAAGADESAGSSVNSAVVESSSATAASFAVGSASSSGSEIASNQTHNPSASVSVELSAVEPVVSNSAPATSEAVPASPDSNEPMPEPLDELKHWLPQQSLGLLSVRSQLQHIVGKPDAPLLVVVQSNLVSKTGQLPPSTPFSVDAAQLFDLMMRAIQVTLGARKVVHLASASESLSIAPAAQIPEVRVKDVCDPQTKAVLLLVQDWNTYTAPIEDHFRLDQPALPVWRIPHPDLLLQQSQLKRQAWTSLQTLQAVL